MIPRPDREIRPHMGMGADFSRGVADALTRELARTIGALAPADRNRVLLQLAAWIATQLEALETSTDV